MLYIMIIEKHLLCKYYNIKCLFRANYYAIGD